MLWAAFTDSELKFRCLFAALCFAIFEWTFRGLTNDDPPKRVLRERFSVTYIYKYGYTTWEQFWMNVFHVPVASFLYAQLVPDPMTRLLLFPLNVWTAEIVWGYFFMLAWRRRAWHYRDRFSFFHGNITLFYLPYWLLLGAMHEAYLFVMFRVLTEMLPAMSFGAAFEILGI